MLPNSGLYLFKNIRIMFCCTDFTEFKTTRDLLFNRDGQRLGRH